MEKESFKEREEEIERFLERSSEKIWVFRLKHFRGKS